MKEQLEPVQSQPSANLQTLREACDFLAAFATADQQRAERAEAERDRLRVENGKLRELVQEVIEQFSCVKPPDDGSDDPCDGEGCLRCHAALTLAALEADDAK